MMDPMTFRIDAIHFHVLPMQTRLPFRYGIATLTTLPHLVVGVDLILHGSLTRGQSADGLPPKWFTKNPDTPMELDLAEMIAAIQNASRIGRVAAEHDVSFAHWWRALYDEQASWSAVREVPPLLANFGVSLIERAVLDALARSADLPLWKLLSTGQINIDLDAVRPDLPTAPINQVVASPPSDQLRIRHTVGLSDPLTDAEIPPEERLSDGLPQSLESAIRHYGLSSFKVKLSGDFDRDRDRLASIASITETLVSSAPSFTVDGNEHFTDAAGFRDYWNRLEAEPACRTVLDHARFIEQPLHRDHALRDHVRTVFEEWSDHPPIIIDESDGALADLPRALDLGYSGTSHKNCKGIVKGLANAALLRPRPNTILSGEDLANVGPLALLQDCAAMALLGIGDIERNGHHYFKGLSMHSEPLQSEVLAHHSDSYRLHEKGFPSLNIQDGKIGIASANQAPFGCSPLIDPATLEPLNDWIKRGGMSL